LNSDKSFTASISVHLVLKKMHFLLLYFNKWESTIWANINNTNLLKSGDESCVWIFLSGSAPQARATQCLGRNKSIFCIKLKIHIHLFNK
jgi:hypothetical protein